jgi:hypothetical protein
MLRKVRLDAPMKVPDAANKVWSEATNMHWPEAMNMDFQEGANMPARPVAPFSRRYKI